MSTERDRAAIELGRKLFDSLPADGRRFVTFARAGHNDLPYHDAAEYLRAVERWWGVLLPMAFFGGSTGVIYRQFSITIVSSMLLSVLVALILSPALSYSRDDIDETVRIAAEALDATADQLGL